MDFGFSSWRIARRHLFQIVWVHPLVFIVLFQVHRNAGIGYQASGAAMITRHAGPLRNLGLAVLADLFPA
jgi:hypothetical protein